MITTVISYCNNDLKFIEENIQQVKKFSQDIIVCYCKYSFNGEPEDESIIQKMTEIASDCTITEIEYYPEKTPKYHHNLMRWKGTESAKNDFILFLDADEIIDGELFSEYLNCSDWKNYDVISYKCYWYFREKRFQAKKTEEAAVLCKKDICNYNYIFSEAERWEFLNRMDSLKIQSNETCSGKIICHHYSWVRTKEEMIKKVKSWGHRQEKDWIALIEEEFSHEFNMQDFVHNYQYIDINK